MKVGIDLGTTNARLVHIGPVEVSFPAGEDSFEVAPVSFETGTLQLCCVARDGRRWKLEFNVRESVNA